MVHQVAPAASGFEGVQRSHHVDARPERRVGRTRRHLERREVDDVRDAMAGDGGIEVFETRHVPPDELDPRHLLIAQESVQAVGFGVQVKHPRPVSALNKVLDDPGADESLRARNQEPRARRLGWSGPRHPCALYVLGEECQRNREESAGESSAPGQTGA